MRRSFLWGTALGAALALVGAAIASVWFKDRPEPLYLRIADDNFDEIFAHSSKDEDGPTSVRLIRSCGIDAFTTDSTIPDHAGSSFVRIDTTPPANLNCLIGEARSHSMSLALARGLDTTTITCLPGWPTRFRNDPPVEYEACRGKNPQPIFEEQHGPATAQRLPSK
ncbi:hypothetical protein [Sphingopyxis sp. YR583]|jgi:hypothetical protein|uniref:hypothetical protein n=1 Tax=Sphingopyxis sp. YR583 TaxID=1881047 RepID=UPI00115FBC39|nr:hypothetical protein [Sphingopyxis sp. YR583]